MAKRLLIAGASGSVGFHALRLAKGDGHWVRTLSRRRWCAAKVSIFADDLWLRDATDKANIRGICSSVDAVISCMGGSLCLRSEEKRGFSRIDFEANMNLLEEAVEAQVPRFIYLSVLGGRAMERTAYARAHRRFERALRESGLDFTIIRLTELFTTLEPIIEMARAGSAPLIGRGNSRTNPIHPEDAARICLENLDSAEEVVDAGGPEVLTRREIVEQIFKHVGEEPNIYRIPGFLLRITGSLTRPFNPRKANLLEFLPTVSGEDSIAPTLGAISLADYLRETSGLLANEPIERVA